MVGKLQTIVVIIISLSIVCCLVEYLSVNATNDQTEVVVFTGSTVLSDSSLNGLTNEGPTSVHYNFNVMGNASFYVLDQSEYSHNDGKPVNYNVTLSQLNINNNIIGIDLPSDYSIIIYSGQDGATVSGINYVPNDAHSSLPFIAASIIFLMIINSFILFYFYTHPGRVYSGIQDERE
jgi:hypothetical protein